jgi:hypothetical protein
VRADHRRLLRGERISTKLRVMLNATRENGPRKESVRSLRERDGYGLEIHARVSLSRDSSSLYDMATTVLRVRLIGGDRIDITYDEPDVSDEDELIEHVILTLAEDSGVLRSRHGDRLVVLYGRGVAAIEVAPRGAVL